MNQEIVRGRGVGQKQRVQITFSIQIPLMQVEFQKIANVSYLISACDLYMPTIL